MQKKGVNFLARWKTGVSLARQKDGVSLAERKAGVSLTGMEGVKD